MSSKISFGAQQTQFSMKILICVSILLAASIFSKGQLIATTSDGKKILLYPNKTWQFADSSKSFTKCDLPAAFVEPKSTPEMLSLLKQSGSTIEDMRKHVSVDNDVNIDQIKIISFSEQLGNALYNLCVDGRRMKYKRTGSVFARAGEP